MLACHQNLSDCSAWPYDTTAEEDDIALQKTDDAEVEVRDM
jgi:hypothetical protein